MLYVGFVLELAGLLVTSRGLLTTWRANTSQPFMPPGWHRLAARARRVIFRRPVEGKVAVGLGSLTLSGSGLAYRGLLLEQPDETHDQRLGRLEHNIELIHQRTLDTMKSLGEMSRDSDRTAKSLNRRIDATTTELAAMMRTLAVDGIRTAVFGLTLTIAGLSVQALAALV